MNKVPDSFAPSQQVDNMWHVRHPNMPMPSKKPVDTKETAKSEKLLDHETNKALFLLLKSCKFFFFLTLGPPFFLFVKLPRGVKRLAVPLIKKAHKNLSEAITKQFIKIKSTLQNAVNRASIPFQAISKASQYLKKVISDSAKKQIEQLKSEINRYLKPPLLMAKSVASGIAKLTSYSVETAQVLVSRLMSFKNRLKGFSIPKVTSDFGSHLQNAFSKANEALQSAWNRMKESGDRAKSLLSKNLEDAKNRLNKIKNWSGEQAKKVKKVAEAALEHVAKVVSPSLSAIKEFVIHPMPVVIAVIQQPYLLAMSMANSARGLMERSMQSALRSFNEKLQVAKVVIIRSSEALLMPFKRGFAFIGRQCKKMMKRVEEKGRQIAKKLRERGQNANKKWTERLRKIAVKLFAVSNFFKRILNEVFQGLKLFWVWIKLMSSFAAFLIKQLFREVLASLK